MTTTYHWTQSDDELAEELANADALELAPVADIDGEQVERMDIAYEHGGERMDGDSEGADFFSVYVHLREGGASCIADRPTYDEALAFAADVARRSGLPLNDYS